MLSSARISQKMAGAAGKTAERARYIQLTRQGLNNAEISPATRDRAQDRLQMAKRSFRA